MEASDCSDHSQQSILQCVLVSGLDLAFVETFQLARVSIQPKPFLFYVSRNLPSSA